MRQDDMDQRQNKSRHTTTRERDLDYHSEHHHRLYEIIKKNGESKYHATYAREDNSAD